MRIFYQKGSAESEQYVCNLICSFGSFSGVKIELKQMINHKNWNIAWIVLAFEKLRWFFVENIL